MKNIKEFKLQWSNREYILFIAGVMYIYYALSFTIRMNQIYQSSFDSLKSVPEEFVTISFGWWWIIFPTIILVFIVKQSFSPITQIVFYIIFTMFLFLFL